MTNFYDGWLQLADNWKEQSAQARRHIHEKELQSKIFQPIARRVFPYLYYEFGDEPE